MLLSILVYGLTAAILCYLGWHVSHREQQARLTYGEDFQLPFYSWEILLSILVIAVVAGARWHTGYDHEMYLNEYTRLLEDGDFKRQRFEWGFKLISKAFALIKAHYFFFFAFWALLQSSLLYFALRDKKFLLPFIGLNLMLGVYFYNWCNSMRQATVACLFIALIPLISKRSWRNFILYTLVVLFATSIHRSAFILLPLYLFTFYKGGFGDRQYHRVVGIAAFALSIVVGVYPVWFKTFTFMPSLLEWVGYDAYNQSALLESLLNGEFRQVHFGPARMSVIITNLLLIYYYPQVREHFKTDRLLPVYFIFALIGICLDNIFMNTSHYILRPIEYLTIFVMICNCYTLVYLCRTEKLIVAVVMGFLIFSYIFWAVYKAAYMPTDVNTPFLYDLFLLH